MPKLLLLCRVTYVEVVLALVVDRVADLPLIVVSGLDGEPVTLKSRIVFVMKNAKTAFLNVNVFDVQVDYLNSLKTAITTVNTKLQLLYFKT